MHSNPDNSQRDTEVLDFVFDLGLAWGKRRASLEHLLAILCLHRAWGEEAMERPAAFVAAFEKLTDSEGRPFLDACPGFWDGIAREIEVADEVKANFVAGAAEAMRWGLSVSGA